MAGCGSNNLTVNIGQTGANGADGADGLLGVQSVCDYKDMGGGAMELVKYAVSLQDPSYFCDLMKLSLTPGSYIFDYSAHIFATSGLPQEETRWSMFITNAGGIVLEDLKCTYRLQIVGDPNATSLVDKHIISISSGIVIVTVACEIRVHAARYTDTDVISVPVQMLRAIKVA